MGMDRKSLAAELRNLARAEKASKMLCPLPRAIYNTVGKVLADINAEAEAASSTDVDRYIDLRAERERLIFELKNLLQFRLLKIHRISMFSLDGEKDNILERETRLLKAYSSLFSEFFSDITEEVTGDAC